MELAGLCLFALIFSFAWFIFSETAGFLFAGDTYTAVLSLQPAFGFAIQLLADVLGAVFIHRILASRRMLARDSLLVKTAKVWLLTMILFVPVIFFSSYLQDKLIQDCHRQCGGSVMCDAHCPGGTTPVFFVAIISAIIGVHNPLTFFLTGFLAKRWIGSK